MNPKSYDQIELDIRAIYTHPRKGTVYLRHDFDGNPVTEWCPNGGYPYVTKGHAQGLERMGYIKQR